MIFFYIIGTQHDIRIVKSLCLITVLSCWTPLAFNKSCRFLILFLCNIPHDIPATIRVLFAGYKVNGRLSEHLGNFVAKKFFKYLIL